MNRIVNIRPVHPARRSSAATMGQPTREDGAQSHIEVAIDRGLKTGKMDIVSIDTDKGVELLAQLAEAVSIALRVNREFDGPLYPLHRRDS